MGQKSNDSYDSYQSGRQHMSRGELAAAEACFRASLSVSPHFKTCEVLGEMLLAERRLQEACVFLGAAVALGTRNFRAMKLLAEALLALEERDLAARHLEEAVALNPNFESAKRLLAELRAADAGPA